MSPGTTVFRADIARRLHGRTVVPGLIESHTHFVSLANRPGYHVAQWELASNLAEVLAILAARRATFHRVSSLQRWAQGRRGCLPSCACRRWRSRRGDTGSAGVSVPGRGRAGAHQTLGKQF